MKKKMYLAVLAMCIALTASACGKETTESKTKVETEVETKQAETKETEENVDKKEKKDASETRLVSVKNLDKYITLGEYKGMTLDHTVNVVTEEDVEFRIDMELTEAAEEVNEPAQNGDIVTINYVGTKDGVAFEGGTANNYDLTLGQGRMIPGFEEGIVGMKKGETKDVDLTFPEDYPAEDLAGQDVVFKMTCQTIRRKAELTDEWVAKNKEQKTVDEYRAAVKAALEGEAEAMARTLLEKNAWNQIVQSSEVIEYPEEDLKNAVAEFNKMTEFYAEQAGMDLEKFVETQQMTMEEYEELADSYSKSKLQQVLIIQAIMDAEGMSLEDEESLKIQEELIKDSGVKDLAALIDRYGQAMVDESIGLLRVERFIVDNAVINEQVVSGDTVAANSEGSSDGESQTPDEEDVVDEELEEALKDESDGDEDTIDMSEDAEQ